MRENIEVYETGFVLGIHQTCMNESELGVAMRLRETRTLQRVVWWHINNIV